jgi:hypothetical protein
MGACTKWERSGNATGGLLRIMRDKRLVYQQAQTFERRPAAAAWIKKREGELAQPGALERVQAKDPPLADVIDQYIKELGREAGSTKAQCLRTIKTDYDIGRLKCSEVNVSPSVRSPASSPRERSNPPRSAITCRTCPPSSRWPGHCGGYPLDPQAMTDASTALRATKVIGKSRQRERRPTLEELDMLMTHFGRVRHKRKVKLRADR